MGKARSMSRRGREQDVAPSPDEFDVLDEVGDAPVRADVPTVAALVVLAVVVALFVAAVIVVALT